MARLHGRRRATAAGTARTSRRPRDGTGGRAARGTRRRTSSSPSIGPARQAAFVSDRDECGKDASALHAVLRESQVAGRRRRWSLRRRSATSCGISRQRPRRVHAQRQRDRSSASRRRRWTPSPPIRSYDKAVFDLWHGRTRASSRSRSIEAGRDRDALVRGDLQLATKKLVQLANDSMPDRAASPTTAASALAASSRALLHRADVGRRRRRRLSSSTRRRATRKLVREKISGNAQLSPDAKYVALLRQGHWYSYDIATGQDRRSHGAAQGRAASSRRRGTRRSTPAPWGVAGWTKGDRSLLAVRSLRRLGARPERRAAAADRHRFRRSSQQHPVPLADRWTWRSRWSWRRGGDARRGVHRSGRAAAAARVRRPRRRRAASIAISSASSKAPEKVVMARRRVRHAAQGARTPTSYVRHARARSPSSRISTSVRALTQLTQDLRREPAAEGLQVGHGRSWCTGRAPTACRSRACSTSRRTSIRPRSTR